MPKTPAKQTAKEEREDKLEVTLRKSIAPTPKTLAELTAYIEGLSTLKHGYGSTVYALSLASVATFNYMASTLGASGFMTNCADLDVLSRIRNMEGPFIICEGYKLLYPQYSLERELRESEKEWKTWAGKEAAKLLKNSKKELYTAPVVLAHWKKLVKEARAKPPKITIACLPLKVNLAGEQVSVAQNTTGRALKKAKGSKPKPR